MNTISLPLLNKLSAKLYHLIIFITLFATPMLFTSCDELLSSLEVELTEAEIAEGLKEALIVGANESVSQTNQTDGYYSNPLIMIPWPSEAQGAYDFIDNNLPVIKPLLNEVVLLMNRGAENASEKATPIFVDAIMAMTIADARNILFGDDNAATQYLYEKTYASLHTAFKPDIYESLETVGAATAWNSITSYYNPLATFTPGINPINTDLADYTTTMALDGLFLLIEEEELKIRTDPVARINDVLKKVFGELD
ncbi:MAG: DUF4197 domain-containing protein [Cyclobacteriaceae bacterium]